MYDSQDALSWCILQPLAAPTVFKVLATCQIAILNLSSYFGSATGRFWWSAGGICSHSPGTLVSALMPAMVVGNPNSLQNTLDECRTRGLFALALWSSSSSFPVSEVTQKWSK